MLDRKPTHDEALFKAVAWATGERSHHNLFLEMEGDGSRPQTLALVAQTDAAEALKWSALAVALSFDRSAGVAALHGEKALTALAGLETQLRALVDLMNRADARAERGLNA